MAKQFAGFTPQQTAVLLQKMGYTGPSDSKAMEQFLAANPAAAARLGKYTETAQRMIAGQPAAKTMPPAAAMGMQAGGLTVKRNDTSRGTRYIVVDAAGNTVGDYANKKTADSQAAKANAKAAASTTTTGTTTGTATTGSTNAFSNINPAVANVIQSVNPAVSAVSNAATTGTTGTGIPTGTTGTPTKAAELAAWEEYKSFKPTPDDMFGAKRFAGRTFTDPATGTTYTSDGTKWKISDAGAKLHTLTDGTTTYINPNYMTVPAGATPTTTTTTPVDTLRAGQQQLITKLFTDPASLVTQAPVETISEADKAAGEIASTTGQLGAGPSVSAEQISAEQVSAPEKAVAETYETAKVSPDVEKVIADTKTVTGTVSKEAQAAAQTMDATKLAQLGMTAEQLATAQTVKAPPPLEVQTGELISGPSVDAAKVEKLLANVQAVEATPSDMATVQGQMAQLLKQFDAKEPPAWAAGAMRKATATLAARGLGASSMAGQAIIQAAMESALPIAQSDAKIRAEFEQQNLSNRQEVAMFAAKQRADFLNLEFNQDFQARVANAARIADVADNNFTAEVQIALENSRNAQTVDIANLNARNAKLLADVAAMTQVDLANLNNRQQAAVQNANAFLQMDMQNLDNEQQTLIFKSQSRIQAMLSDTASENARRQFNATSKMQVDQFNTNLASSIQQFNVAQKNAIAQFNMGEANSLKKFNAEIQNSRETFEAQQAVLIAQANAKWRQDIATTESANKQAVNLQNAKAATDMTTMALDNLMQRERDLMGYAFTAAENELTRSTELLVAKLDIDAKDKLARNEQRADLVSSIFQSLASLK